jgi:hypothetical protein
MAQRHDPFTALRQHAKRLADSIRLSFLAGWFDANRDHLTAQLDLLIRGVRGDVTRDHAKPQAASLQHAAMTMALRERMRDGKLSNLEVIGLLNLAAQRLAAHPEEAPGEDPAVAAAVAAANREVFGE